MSPLSLTPLFACVAAAAALATADPASSPSPPADTLVVRNVTVVDAEADRLLAGRDVLVVGSRIVGVAPTGSFGEVPGGAPEGGAAMRVLDGSGGYLVPGLWDAHVHLESVPGESTLALDIALANGVTTVRDLGTRLDFDGFTDLTRRSDPTPRVVGHGAMIDGPPGAWPGIRVAATPDEGRTHVRQVAAEGWPAVKAYSLLGRDTYRAIADEAQRLGLLLVGHVPESVTLTEAVEAGQRGIAHIGRVTQACSGAERDMVEANRRALGEPDPLSALMEVMAGHNATTLAHWSETRCREVGRLLAEAGVAVTPTLMVADFYLGKDPPPDDPRLASVPVDVRAQWREADFRRAQMTEEMLADAPEVIAMDWRTVRILHEEGVPILAGTDAAWMNPFIFHGFTLHDELARLVEAGLTPAAALAAATTVPERHFAPDGPVGIVVGARADLVLLEHNPLDAISATRGVRAVVVGGAVLDKAALERLGARVEERAARPIADIAAVTSRPLPVSTPSVPGRSPDEVRSTLDSLRRAHGVPGLVAAWSESDGRVRTVATGTIEPGGEAPMPDDARMLAGSIGKSFVAATVLALHGEGVVDLDDPVERWVGDRPWFGRLAHGPRITLRHLLTHTAGIADHVHDPEFAAAWAARRRRGEPPPGPDALIAFVADDPSLFPPGEGWSYSDTGYLILGLVVEAATGRPLFEEVRARLLEPLGLDRTTPSDHRELDGLVAGWVDPDNPFGLPRSTVDAHGVMRWDPVVEGAGGGLITTPENLVRWGGVLFSGEALATPYLADLLRGVPTRRGSDRVLYGAGVSMHLGGALGPVFGHAGAVPGYLSTLRHYPRHGVTLAIQLNTDGPFARGADAGEVMAEFEEALASLVIVAGRVPEAPADVVPEVLVQLGTGSFTGSPAESPVRVTRHTDAIGIVEVQTPSIPASENGMRATPTTPRDEDAVYRLTVRGRVGEGWREWFGADELRPGETSTEIVVRVADQAELLGRLRRVLDLDLQLVELALLPSPRVENPDPGHTPATDITDSETSGDAS